MFLEKKKKKIGGEDYEFDNLISVINSLFTNKEQEKVD